MRRPPFLAGCESAIRLMATTLLLPPAVDPTDAGACIDRWREQRIAEIAIVEFGYEARAQASDRLRQVAGDAEREAIPPAPPVSMTERRDGVRVSGEPITERVGRWNGSSLAMSTPIGDRSLGGQEDRHVA